MHYSLWPNLLLLYFTNLMALAQAQYGGYQYRPQPQQQQQQQPQQQQQASQNQQAYGYNQQQQQQRLNGYYGRQQLQTYGAYGQTNQNAQSAQQAQSGAAQKAFVNTPVQLNNASIGATVYFKINSYKNQNWLLPNGTTCSCPATFSCTYVKKDVATCQFSFTAVLSAKDQSVQYVSSGFFPVVNNVVQSGTWDQTTYSFAMTTKPTSIDVFVQLFGLVIDQATGNIVQYDSFQHVDVFVFKLDQVRPGNLAALQPASGSLSGAAQQMSVSFGYQCTGLKQGLDCDLTCNQSSTNSGYAACTSSDGVQKICTYSGSTADNCQTCPYGFTANQTACQEYNSVVTSRSGVSKAFRTWTIVLGVLLGVSILFILILLAIYLWLRNREKETEEETTPPPQNRYMSNGYNSAASRPLIQKQDEWDHEPVRPTAIGQTSRPPMSGEAEISRQSDDSFSRSNTGTAPRREAQV